MALKNLTLFSLCISLSLLSCQKQLELEDVPSSTGGNNNSLPGEYTMVNLKLVATSTATYSEGGMQVKAVTYTDYTTKNNTGVVVINNNQIQSNNISYSIDTTVTALFYFDNLLVDSVGAPFAMDMPTYNATATFTQVGTDSLTFSNGFIDVPSGTGQPVQNAATGARYSWSGDTLILSSAFTVTNSKVIDGTPVNFLYKGTQWTRLKKK